MTMQLKGANILVTGGFGFIGSNLAIKLVILGSKVTILDSLDKNCGGNAYNIEPIKNYVKIKIFDMAKESELIPVVKNKDYIFNLAGQPSHSVSILKPYSDLNNNLYAHLSLLESCRKNNKNAVIIYTGTRSQYGKAIQLPVGESHPLNPTDINGVNKLAAEKYHLMYANLHSLKVCCLRLANIYGPRHQMKSSQQGFVNWFIRQAIDNKNLALFGDGNLVRDVLYVEDCVDAIIQAALAKKALGQVYNVGSGKPISIKKIAEQITKICGSGKFEIAEYPKQIEKIEIGDFYANINKIEKDVGWKPKTDFVESLKKTIEFYKENKKHYW